MSTRFFWIPLMHSVHFSVFTRLIYRSNFLDRSPCSLSGMPLSSVLLLVPFVCLFLISDWVFSLTSVCWAGRCWMHMWHGANPWLFADCWSHTWSIGAFNLTVWFALHTYHAHCMRARLTSSWVSSTRSAMLTRIGKAWSSSGCFDVELVSACFEKSNLPCCRPFGFTFVIAIRGQFNQAMCGDCYLWVDCASGHCFLMMWPS